MKIVVVFGGKSVEHEISIISAFQVIEILKTKYEVLAVYASKSNEFYYNKNIAKVKLLLVFATKHELFRFLCK